jgi:general secretion pathway protein L
MPQRIVALDIADSTLKAAVLQTTFRDYRLEALYAEEAAPADGSPAERLRQFVADHLHPGDTLLSALPGDLVTWRTFFLPFRDQKRLGQTVPFELESNVPFGLDDVVVDYQILHRDRAGTLVLAALVEKSDLERHLKLLEEAGVDPKIVDVGPLAALNTLSLVPELPEGFAFLDIAPRTTTVALYRSRQLAGLRTLSRAAAPASGGNGAAPPAEGHTFDAEGLIDEIRWTLLALNGAPLDGGLPCYLAGDPACVAAVEEGLSGRLALDPRRIDRLTLRNVGSHAGEVARFSTSVGLALREVATAESLGVNFRRGEFTFHRSQQELRRALGGVAALAAVVVALIVGDLYMEYRVLAARAAAIEGQIQKVFGATILDAGRVADPVAQLQTEITTLQERTAVVNDVVPVSSRTAIDILWAISSIIPNSIRVDTEEYSMDPDSVRVRANTDTFESVDAIKQKLMDIGLFRDVQVKDAKAGKDGKGVDFRMTLFLNKDFRPGGEGRG